MKTLRALLSRYWLFIVGASVAFVFASVLLGYFFGWDWVGVTQFTVTTSGESEVYPQKTLWDWLDLLIVPFVLATGAWWLNRAEKENERELALDRQRQESLEQYFDRMSDLLLRHDLRKRDDEGLGEEARTMARARTLTVLGSLDPQRKARVIAFLFEARLIDKHGPVISLYGADLRHADLANMGLSGVDFSGAILEQANLEEASLKNARLTRAYLDGADLVGADLTEVESWGVDMQQVDLRLSAMQGVELSGDMAFSNFRRADLQWATLSGNLQNADLRRANLSHAHLSFADLSGANLDGAKYTEGENPTKWPNGFDPQAAGAILVDENGQPIPQTGER